MPMVVGNAAKLSAASGAAALVPAQRWRDAERDQRSDSQFRLINTTRFAVVISTTAGHPADCTSVQARPNGKSGFLGGASSSHDNSRNQPKHFTCNYISCNISSQMKQSFFQQEIKQTKPFYLLRAEAGVGLLNAADALRRSFAAVVKQRGVSTQQYNILAILRGAGNGGLATREIASRLIEKWPGVTRFLDQLESRGLIERERSTDDRRRVLCRITQSGLDLLETLDQPVHEWEERSLRCSKRPSYSNCSAFSKKYLLWRCK